MAAELNSNIPGPREQVIPSGANLFKAAFLLGALLISFYLTQRGIELLEQTSAASWLKWTFIALMALWDSFLVLGMGVMAHDAVHKVLFRSLFWNELIGTMLSAFTLIPFRANRQFHLTHHRFSHQPGLDPENEMHNYPFPIAAAVGLFIGLFAQYRILVLEALRGRDWTRALKDVASLSVAALVYFALVPAFGISLLNTVVPLLLILPMLFSWRALSDHYGIPAVVRKPKETGDGNDMDKRQEVGGWVVLTHPWLEWLWSNVNYHEVHHKYPYLSYHYLPQVFAATRNEYPYLVVDGYWRSLLSMRKRNYYARPEEVKSFSTIP